MIIIKLLYSKTMQKLSELSLCSNKKPDVKLSEGFTITCHTGAIYTKANSLESIEASINWGAQIVEFDVTFRPDGTPVIIHNSKPDQNQGILFEKALDEVAKSNTCKINLDIKSTANLPAVDKLVKAKGLENRVFYTGVFEDWIETVKSNSSIPFFINYNPNKTESNSKEYIEKIINKAKETGAIGINSNFRGVSNLMVDTLKANGLLVSLWTANRIPDMLEALSFCPDNITTKKPHILRKLIMK